MQRLRRLFHRHASTPADRTALMGTLAAGINFILALVKLGLGLVTGSLWLLLFGGYYLILSSSR